MLDLLIKYFKYAERSCKFRTLSTHIFVSGAIVIPMKMGGVSGGGGLVIDPKAPLKPQDPRKVEEHIRCTRHPIFHYLKYKNDQLNKNKITNHDDLVFEQILKAKPNIFDAFDSVPMIIENNKTCLDYDLNKVDGSYLPNSTNSVCISAANIAQKVDYSEVKSQSAALIIHEYSEVLGKDEAFAQEIQKLTLSDFKKWEKYFLDHEGNDPHCAHHDRY